jgi:ribonuclease HII
MSSAPALDVEQSLHAHGARFVAGVDEVGRGALAGPVSVGIAVVDAGVGPVPEKLRDSKVISRTVREGLIEPVSAWVVDYAIGHAQPAEIDEMGIVAALRLAWTRAYEQLTTKPDHVILDGKHNWIAVPESDLFSLSEGIDVPVTMKIKADAACASVAAASVLAKVARDDLMREAAVRFPAYGWEGNVGYGSTGHMQALVEFGATEFHRRSWNLPGQHQA